MTECILYQGHINKDGYGRYNGKNVVSGYVHRQAFYEANGYLPDAPKIVGHLCEVRNCINPDHLAEQTQKENVKQYKDRITHCPRGHEYNEENTYIRKNGARKCRACNKEYMRKRQGYGLDKCQTQMV